MIVFCNNEIGHDQITFASFLSLSIRAAGIGHLHTPPWRFGGSSTFSVVRRGVTSTPRSAGFTLSSCFFRLHDVGSVA